MDSSVKLETTWERAQPQENRIPDDLTGRVPDDFVAVGKPDDPERWVNFYYGAKQAAVNTLPKGAQFGVVLSPNMFVHAESPLRPWKVTLFEVSEYRFQPKKPLERSYKEVEKRLLTDGEVEYFETLRRVEEATLFRAQVFAVGAAASVDGEAAA